VKPAQAPEIEKLSDDPVSDSIERHPAYAQISAARFTVGGGAISLYGSDFAHRAGVSITIRRSELHRGLSEDRAFAREELIEVMLSEAQWAAFVSTLNAGSGIQCTLNHMNREEVPQIAEPPRRKEQFQNELKDRLAEAVATLKSLTKLVEDGKKVPLREAVRSLRQQLESSLPFVADQFNEHVESVTEAARIEVAAYLSNAVQRAGLQALGANDQPIKLPGVKDD
jgi:hypothetical protein